MRLRSACLPDRAWRRAAVLAIVAVAVALLSASADAQQTKQRPASQAGQPAAAKPAAPPAVAPAPAPLAAIDKASSAEDPYVEEIIPPDVLAKGYALGIGDVVRITVFQQPDMTTDTRVSESGTITVPLVGAVPVAGATTKQAEQRIVRLLKARGFVRDPQVNVSVLQFKSRQISVLGLVNRPGRYPLEEGAYRITDALALAGGILPGASDIVTLARAGDGGAQRFSIDIPSLFRGGNYQQNLEVRNGDTLFVDRAPMFYIYGEVQRPGSFRLEKDMTVMQALSVGGGLTVRGTEKNMRLHRRDASGRTAMLTPSLNDPLQPDDVLYVRESLF